MNIYELREKIGREIVDYNQLKDILKDYMQPRKKVSHWLANNELIRVKKGLYIFGASASRHPFSIETLANLIYGPSAISLNYALSYYGLIPERVHTITSITNKKNKTFETPVGHFTYRYLNHQKYAIGLQLIPQEKSNIIIATPEKALCDLITLTIKDINFNSKLNVRAFLLDDLRMDEDALKNMNLHLMTDIAHQYQNRRLNQFIKYYKD